MQPAFCTAAGVSQPTPDTVTFLGPAVSVSLSNISSLYLAKFLPGKHLQVNINTYPLGPYFKDAPRTAGYEGVSM